MIDSPLFRPQLAIFLLWAMACSVTAQVNSPEYRAEKLIPIFEDVSGTVAGKQGSRL